MNLEAQPICNRILSLAKATTALLLFLFFLAPMVRAEVTISEFMAVNDSILDDEDGDDEDWIEIHNDSASTVNLAGWFLTDNATNLEKWRFPSIEIPADGYLVVFASNKDRRNPNFTLHTNFKLSGSGEYLALVKPDGMIANDFNTYPAQFSDISYGMTGSAGGDVGLVLQNAQAIANSPTSLSEYNTEYSGWNTLGFLPTSSSFPVSCTWTSSTVYSTSGGTSDDEHKLSKGYLDDGSTAGGYGATITLSGIPFSTYRVYGLLSSDGSNGGLSYQTIDFRVNGTWAFGGVSAKETTAYGNIDVNFSNHGAYWTEINPNTTIGNYWAIETSGSSCTIQGDERNGSSRGSIAAIIIEPTGGGTGAPICFNFASSDSSENFSGGQNIGPLAIDSSDWHNTSTRDSGALNSGAMTINASTGGWQSGLTGIGFDADSVIYDSWIGEGGDVQDIAYNENASVFMRIPFSVANTNPLALSLRMRYDDGFNAYLNGTLVATDNADPSPNWNSTAPSDRADSLNNSWANFDLTSHIPLLNAGSSNVLAFQVFNSHSGNSDLLLLPELEASYTATSNSVSYLLSPTPGSANGIGTTTIGPSIRDSTYWPLLPNGGVGAPDLVITSKVVSTLNPLQTVNLHYRTMFNTETTVAMTAIGGDLYTANIPVTSVADGEMVRWRIEATDDQSVPTTDPFFADSTEAEYYGTVIQPDYVVSKLPVLHLFAPPTILGPGPTTEPNPVPADTKYDSIAKTGGGRVSAYFDGEFYDNILMELRGNSTAGYNKKSHNLRFHTDHKFRHAGGGKRLKKTSFTADYPDPTYMRQGLSFWLLGEIGAPGPFYEPYRLQLNGAFYQLANHNDLHGEDLLERLGYDPNGALYNAAGTIVPSGFSTGGFDKKTREWENNDDYVTMANAIAESLPTDQRGINLFDNFDLPQVINYLVSARFVNEHDDVWANMSVYHDNDGDDLWRIIPFDMNLSWGAAYLDTSSLSGIQVDDDALKCHPLYGSSQTPFMDGWNWNRIYDAIFEVPETREMFLRRMRTVLDTHVKPVGTATNELPIEAKVLEWFELIAEEAGNDRDWWGWPGKGGQSNFDPGINVTDGVNSLISDFIEKRREHFYGKHSIANTALPVGITKDDNAGIPLAQPTNIVLSITALEFFPASGIQDEEYICITNANNYAVDISGWEITGAVTHTMQPGTVIPTHSALYLSPNSRAFRNRSVAPTGGQGLFVQGGYKGQLSARGETVNLLNPTGTLVDQFTYVGTPTDAQNHLRISEVMYAPTAPTASELAADPYLLDTDFEFIEFVNTGTTPIDLGGAQITDGVAFIFPAGFSLPAGGYAVVSANTNAFALRYGGSATVAGQFSGYLNNNGETIVLLDSVGEKVLDFTYNDSWYRITDGHDFSLVINDVNTAWTNWNHSTSWHASANLQGSPGLADPAPPVIGNILINEVLTHTDLPFVDTIELYNPEGTGINIGGWFLTDDFYTPKKFRIPNGTMLGSDGYVVYDEYDFFYPDTNSPTSFQLSSTGDEVWLFSADAQSNLTGHVHGLDFGAAQNGVSFGRYVTSISEEHFPAQSALSLGAVNAGPKVGPIVISEIMYHPSDLEGANNVRDEYIELTNVSGSSFDLFSTTNTWRVRNAVDFDFPTGTSMAAGDRILLVSFDPLDTATLAAFRAVYGVSPSVPVFGPWSGTLNNGGEEIELKWPDNTNLDGSVPYILAEEVGYETALPWDAAANGTDQSLRRVDNTLYGDDPVNWQAASPSPGTAIPTPDIDPPAPNPATFAAAPRATSGSEISMTATTGSDVRRNHPIEYLFTETSGNPGGTSSAWQTSPSYTDIGLTMSLQYTYTVTLRDSVGNTGTASAPASAIAIGAPTPNPATFAVAPAADSTTAISMTATTGSDPDGPVEYFFTETSGNPGGTSSAWQTSPSYTDTGLTPSTLYTYTVTLRDSLGNTGTASAPANATTLAGPAVFYSQPLDSDPGWATEGLWGFGVPAGSSGVDQYGGPDPSSGHTGTKVYGYNLTGDYEANLLETHLTSSAIDCSGQEDVHLKFWRWLGVEQPQYDHAYVQVSTNGLDWIVVWENANTVDDSSWSQVDFDISAVADNQSTVYLRWTMGTTDTVWHFCGWNIDDIELFGIAQGPGAVPHIGAPVITPEGYLAMDLYTVPGYRYTVDSTTNLVTQPFLPFMEGIEATADITVITITNLVDEEAFYRLRFDP